MTKAVDVYSFAMIMIELYTSERLFKGMEAHQLMFLVRIAANAHFYHCTTTTSSREAA